MKKKIKNEKGSMLIAVLLIMLMISAISISLLVRSTQGTQMGIISRDSHNAYQLSDQKAEEILINLQKLDAYDKTGKTNLSDDGLIPENTKASELCYNNETEKTICYPRKDDGTPDLLNPLEKKADRAKDIYFVQRNGITSRTQRAVLAPVMDRAVNPISALKVDETSDPASCSLVLKFKCSTQTVTEDKLEVRMATDANDTEDNFSGEWMKLTGSYDDKNPCNAANDPDAEYIIQIDSSNFKQNTTDSFHFIVKNKSDRKFMLDSLYVKAEGSFAPTGSSCSGS